MDRCPFASAGKIKIVGEGNRERQRFFRSGGCAWPPARGRLQTNSNRRVSARSGRGGGVIHGGA